MSTHPEKKIIELLPGKLYRFIPNVPIHMREEASRWYQTIWSGTDFSRSEQIGTLRMSVPFVYLERLDWDKARPNNPKMKILTTDGLVGWVIRSLDLDLVAVEINRE